MKSFAILIFVLVFALITAGQGLAAEKKLAPQESCPVLGFKINKEAFVDYEGKRVYFCCPKCREKFNADPAGYLKKMEEEGFTPVETPNSQTKCPVLGGDINKEVFIDCEGKRIYFCCPGCDKKFKAGPDEYLKKLEEEGVDLENTPGMEHNIRQGSEKKKHEQQHQH